METKFNIGNKIYKVRSCTTGQNIKCPACEGEGKIEAKDKTYQICTSCNGSGQICISKQMPWTVHPKPFIIKRIYLKADINTHEEFYDFGYITAVNVKDLFISMKEAKAECKKRNKLL